LNPKAGLIQIFLKRVFYEESEKQPIVFFFQSVVSYLRFLKLVLADLNLGDFAVKPIQSVISTKQPTIFLTVLTKFC